MSEINESAWVAKDLAANRRYLESEGAEGAPAQWISEDLAGQDLTGATLAEATLIEATFSGCAMKGADLGRAQAGGARFDRARLAGANFTKATLVGACFDDADATTARFVKAQLSGASLAWASLVGADLEGVVAIGVSLQGAALREASLFTAILDGADLSGADLTGARFERTVLDAETKLVGATGIEHAIVTSIVVGGVTPEGERARAWLLAQAGLGKAATWSSDALQLYLLAKMSSPRIAEAAQRLGASEAELRRVAAELGAVFDRPGHRAAEYRTMLGEPRTRVPVQSEGAFAGSSREEYVLPTWPDVVFVVHEDRNGAAWGVGFEGGPAKLPADLAAIEPWRWTAERLRREARTTEVLEEWSYDLEAVLTFTTTAGSRRFRARFDLGLLQSWTEEGDASDPGVD